MTKTYSNEMEEIINGKHTAFINNGAKVRCIRATVTLSAQANGDQIVLGHLPQGASFKFGILNASSSLGTATVEIGTDSDADKYKASAVFTTVNTPVLFGVLNTEVIGPGGEDVVLKIGTAALPASGTLLADIYYTDNA